MKEASKKRQLRWNMIVMLLLCWALPLMLLTICMLSFVSNKMNKQIENTIEISADKAIEICQTRVSDAIYASRNASYIPTVKEGYQQYLRDKNEEKLYNTVNSFLTQQYKYNENFLSTTISFINEPCQTYYTYRTVANLSTFLNVREFVNDSLAIVKEKAEKIGTETLFLDINNRMYMVRNLMDYNFKPYAVLVMEIDTKSMFGGLESVWGYRDCEVYLGQDAVLNSNTNDKFKAELIKGVTNRSIFTRDENGTFVYQVSQLDSQLLAYVVELDTEAIVNELDNVRYVFFLFMIFMIPLVIMVIHFFHVNITKPINSLIKVTGRIAEGEYGLKVSESYTSREFAYLGDALDSMSEKLKYQFEQIYLEELALKDANILALQSQINPHFLNNTLEIINWEARMTDNYKVSAMIEALSTMLEATMDRKKQKLIALSEELTYIDAYLLIISHRFGDKFEVEKNIDNSLLRVKVPRLIIQPIVENAVEHGMDIQRRGKVSIDIYAKENKMYIEVTDNGILTKENQEKIAMLLGTDGESNNVDSMSLGIRNVDRRLRIIYGEECGLSICSNKDNNTVSTIVIKMDAIPDVESKTV